MNLASLLLASMYLPYLLGVICIISAKNEGVVILGVYIFLLGTIVNVISLVYVLIKKPRSIKGNIKYNYALITPLIFTILFAIFFIK
tara:strand:+ start:1573 stop:1833 length:261 start_codon:yes stop_codon:yes gene_type:complete